MKFSAMRDSAARTSGQRLFVLRAIALLVVWLCGPANGLSLEIEFRFIDGAASNDELQRGMNDAAAQWEQRLLDPVNIVIDVRTVPLFELGFAQGGTFRVPEIITYADVRAAMLLDAMSIDDRVAVAHLPKHDQLVFRAIEPTGEPFINAEMHGINGYLDVPRANAKSLGLPLTGEPTDPDAEIQWNEFFVNSGAFDFNRADGITGTDFVSVAVHEIGHALGFLSGADDFDESSLPNGPFAPLDLREFAILNVPDLYRHSVDSVPHLDVAPGGQPFFSIDGARSSIGTFASGIFNGDGSQAGHWQDGQGVMDGLLRDFVEVPISTLDLRLMDVIGWDVERAFTPSDIDLLTAAIRANAEEPALDHNQSGSLDHADLEFFVHETLQTYFGDSNLDGEFNSRDFVNVFAAGEYEDERSLNSTWGTGDWNGDGDFTSQDFVQAFQDGGYEQGPRPVVVPVPEPNGLAILCTILVTVCASRCRSWRAVRN